MKKFIIFLIIICMTTSSCGVIHDPYVTSTSTGTYETIGTYITSETANTNQSSFDTTYNTLENTTSIETVPIETTKTLPYTIEYFDIANEYNFNKFEKYANIDSIYGKKLSMSEFTYTNKISIPLRIIIIGVYDDNYKLNEQSYYTCTLYYIRIIDDFANGLNEDMNLIYKLTYFGTPENQYYGRPTLEVGKEYIAMGCRKNLSENETNMTFGSTFMYPIEEIDGVEYIYSYGADMSCLDCAVKITDEAENQVYKPGHHDQVIAYMKANKIPPATFDYKCEYGAFLLQTWGITVK